jgi:hypothetical protein
MVPIVSIFQTSPLLKGPRLIHPTESPQIKPVTVVSETVAPPLVGDQLMKSFTPSVFRSIVVQVLMQVLKIPVAEF